MPKMSWTLSLALSEEQNREQNREQKKTEQNITHQNEKIWHDAYGIPLQRHERW